MDERPRLALRPAVMGPRVPEPVRAGLGRLRKIALVGTASTVKFTPWEDPSWEIWAHASSHVLCHRVDRYFDLHGKELWGQEKKWDPTYRTWLARNPVPIYMQERYSDVPASVRYPRERVLMEFRRYFTSHVSWMIALGLMEGVTHFGFFGVHYANDDERTAQRAGTEYMMGVAEGRGVQLVIPEGNPLLGWPSKLYGYESHVGGKLIEEYRWIPKGPTVPSPKGGKPRELTVIDMDDPTKPRPPLKVLDEPVDWAKSGHQHHL